MREEPFHDQRKLFLSINNKINQIMSINPIPENLIQSKTIEESSSIADGSASKIPAISDLYSHNLENPSCVSSGLISNHEVEYLDGEDSLVKAKIQICSSPSKPHFSVDPKTVESPMPYHDANSYETSIRQSKIVRKFLKTARRNKRKGRASRLVTLTSSPGKDAKAALRKVPVPLITGPHIKMELFNTQTKESKRRFYQLHENSRLFPVDSEHACTVSDVNLLDMLAAYDKENKKDGFFHFLNKKVKRESTSSLEEEQSCKD